MTLNGVSRDCQKFYVLAIISETGKATDFKFGRYIHRVHPNRIPLKILEKREHEGGVNCPDSNGRGCVQSIVAYALLIYGQCV